MGPELVYVGRVGSGFDDRLLTELRHDLDGIARPAPPCSVPRGLARGSVFVEPELACEVRYTELTSDGSLPPLSSPRLSDTRPYWRST